MRNLVGLIGQRASDFFKFSKHALAGKIVYLQLEYALLSYVLYLVIVEDLLNIGAAWALVTAAVLLAMHVASTPSLRKDSGKHYGWPLPFGAYLNCTKFVRTCTFAGPGFGIVLLLSGFLAASGWLHTFLSVIFSLCVAGNFNLLVVEEAPLKN